MLSFIDETGGAISAGESGSILDSAQGQREVDPDNWLETMFHALGDYVKNNVNPDVVDIRFSFPSSADIVEFLPFRKVLVHFEVDNLETIVFGFGDNIVNEEFHESGTVVGWEVLRYHIFLDVGVWCSAASGGSTSRMRVFEQIHRLFDGANRFKWIREHVGVEIISFNGGSFIQEEINDQTVFRVVGMSLAIRVFARRKGDAVVWIQEIGQIQEIYIDPNLQVAGDEILIEG